MLHSQNSLHSTIKQGSAITIGTFDGVHIGHQKIIEQLLLVAQKENLKSIVLTLFPHPRMVLQATDSIKLLNTIDERKEILSKFGVEQLVVKPFTKKFSNLSAEEYVKGVLVDELNAKQIIIGYDHRFGKSRSANINDLIKFGEKFNFKVTEISAQDVEYVAVSSTKIRHALHIGDVITANSFLGYNYFLTGTIVKGKGIGKTINFPTANLYIKEDYKLIPKDGVYVVKTSFENKTVYGMMNIGTNPTVNGTEKTIEIHLFNFNKDLYNSKLRVEILNRLRNEKKFDSIKQLKEQLKIDQENAESFIRTHLNFLGFTEK